MLLRTIPRGPAWMPACLHAGIQARRRGAKAVEFAIISPVLLMLLFGLIIGGLGIFRYQQMAALAREAARYAAVHGKDYERETGQAAATQASIFNEAVLPHAAGLDPARINCTVTWDQSNHPKRVDADGTTTINVVTVTVSYQWLPELYFGGVTLRSTSTVPMSH